MRLTESSPRILLMLAVGSAMFCLQVLAPFALGQTYYVSSDGNDANNGTSTTTPWKSISKVNSVVFAPGAAVLFRCGDTFRGQLTIYQSGVTLSSYGSGPKPIITGAERLIGWTKRGQFYATKASAEVRNLFANGVQMTLARFPNSGFIPIATTDGTTTLTANEITQASGSWAGATWRGRTVPWSYETRVVSAHNGNSLTLTKSPSHGLTVGWGFYLDNKLVALDTDREWYCDPSTDSVYFRAPGGVDPNTLVVYGSILDYGVSSARSNITVKGLRFEYQCSAALSFSGGYIQLLSNEIFGGRVDGIRFAYGATNCTVSDNVIQDVNDNGIVGPELKNSTIRNNSIRRVGLVKGFSTGCDGIQTCAGMYNLIVNNSIDSVGNDGIFGGSYCTISGNVIRNAMQTYADGGAIYMGQCTSTIVRHNMIIDVPGCNEGTPLFVGKLASATFAIGIYLDQPTYRCTIDSNTIIRAGTNGVFLGAQDTGNVISDNIMFGCGNNYDGGFISYIIDSTTTYGMQTIKRNICYPTQASVRMVYARQANRVSSSATFISPGTIDSNYYCNPFGDTKQFYLHSYPGGVSTVSSFSLSGWRTLTGQDAHSRVTKGTGDTLFMNLASTPLVVNLGKLAYCDLDGYLVTGNITVQPLSSRYLIGDTSNAKKPNSAMGALLQDPGDYTLYQNYPNPFNPATEIRYRLPVEAKVRLEVFDTIGCQVALLVDETQRAGDHNVTFSNPRLATGIYFYRLSAGGFAETRKMFLLK